MRSLITTGEVVLECRLRAALAQLNAGLAEESMDDAVRKLIGPAGATLEARNRAFHRMLVDGVTVEYVAADGRVRGAQVRVVDFDAPEANDWLAVNQFTVVENKRERRPDIVLFVNGLPLGVVELKNPTEESAFDPLRVPAASDLQDRNPLAVRVQRGVDRVGRTGSPDRNADCLVGVVQAVAHDDGRDAGRPEAAAVAGTCRGGLRSAPAVGPCP